MAAVTKNGTPSISTATPPTNSSLSGLKAGEAIAAGDACYIKTSDGLVYKSTGAAGTVLDPPIAPDLSTATSGGTIDDGRYGVVVTYITSAGESLPSEASFIDCAGASADESTLTIASPPAATGATKFRAYVTDKDKGVFTLQNGAGTNIGTGLTITTQPTTNGAEPPETDTSGSHATAVVDGFSPVAVPAGEAMSLYWNVRFAYGSGMSPGTFLYLSSTTAGGLDTVPSGISTVPVARVIDATRIEVLRSY